MEGTEGNFSPIAENLPRPDPSALTTAQLRSEITHLRELIEEKFKAVQIQFEMSDTALKAALAATEKAAAKTEADTNRQFETIFAAQAQNEKDLQRQIDDLKLSATAHLNKGVGAGHVFAIGLSVLTAAGIIAGLFAALSR